MKEDHVLMTVGFIQVLIIVVVAFLLFGNLQKATTDIIGAIQAIKRAIQDPADAQKQDDAKGRKKTP